MPQRFLLSIALASAGALLAAGASAGATPAQTKAAQKKAAAKAAAKTAVKRSALKTAPASARQQAAAAAKGLALATETVEEISAAQLDVAARVLTGQADCEFNQRIDVAPLDGRPGYFTVSHMGKHYRMLPRETSTGAVRLEDTANGIVWLQIPTKSMLMNARRGQRMVDGCMQAEQHAAVSAAAAGGAQGIGIVAPAAAVAVAADTGPTVAPVVQSDLSTPVLVITPSAALAPPAATGPNTGPDAAGG